MMLAGWLLSSICVCSFRIEGLICLSKRVVLRKLEFCVLSFQETELKKIYSKESQFVVVICKLKKEIELFLWVFGIGYAVQSTWGNGELH